MAYSEIPAYVIEQLVSSDLINTLVESTRYVAEDILGVESGDSSGIIPALILDNGATDGGAIYFKGGTDAYLKADAAGTYVQFEGFNIVVPSPHIIQGDRVFLSFWGNASLLADHYASTETASYYAGYRAEQAGSIIGINFQIYNVNTASITVQLEAHVNGSNVLATSGISVTNMADVASTYTNQDRGIDTFVDGDYIDAFVNFTSGGNILYWGGGIELILD